jgi:hypothetical protein
MCLHWAFEIIFKNSWRKIWKGAQVCIIFTSMKAKATKKEVKYPISFRISRKAQKKVSDVASKKKKKIGDTLENMIFDYTD